MKNHEKKMKEEQKDEVKRQFQESAFPLLAARERDKTNGYAFRSTFKTLKAHI